MSRRARRVQTGEHPIVTEPAIAAVAPAEPARTAAAFEADLPTRDNPAPLLDAVLAPAEPFQLLEPRPAADAPVSPVAEPSVSAPAATAAASAPASTWLADSFATLSAAQAAATSTTPAAASRRRKVAPGTTTSAPQTAAPQSVAAPEPVVAPEPMAAPQPTAAPQPIAVPEPVAAPLRQRVVAAQPVAAPEPAAASEPAHAPRPSVARGPIAAPRVAETPEPAAPRVTEPTAPRVTETAAPRAHAERPRTERIEPLTGPIPAPAASGVDEFEAAARLFAFTGETPVQEPAAETVAEPAKHTAPRRPRRGGSFKRVATASFSIGVFGVVGLMAVGMTTPVEAVAAVSGTDATMSVLAPADSEVPVIDEAEIQAYVAPGDAQNDTLQRTENYTTTTTAQLASEAGIKNFSNLFHNNPNSNIQWPFAVGVTMSYGFGMRSGRMHEGVDFTPGAGAPVQAIAAGTVRIASEAGGAYGVHVVIDHIVDGQMVSSHYAHMQYGSLKVTAGQQVTVGTVIGRTGNTGRSYGAHTHFEIWKNGTTPIDPMTWLRTYTDGTHAVG